MIRKFLVMAVVAVAATLAAATQSQAAFTIAINSTLMAQDNVLNDTDNTVGVITFDSSFQPGGTVAGYVVQITARLTNNGLGFGGANVLNVLVNASTTPAVVSPLTILTTSDGVAFPVLTGNVQLLNAVSYTQFSVGTASATSTIATSPYNTPIVPPTGSTTTPANLTGGAPQQGNSSMLVTLGLNPFTLSNTLVINGLAGQGASFSGTLTSTVSPLASDLNALPAPAGLLLAAFGIPAFGLLRRFGRKVDATVAA